MVINIESIQTSIILQLIMHLNVKAIYSLSIKRKQLLMRKTTTEGL